MLSAREDDFFGLVDAGREIGRAALVWVKLHHQPAMRGPDLGFLIARPQTEHVISVIGGHATAPATRLPWVFVIRMVLTNVAPVWHTLIEIGLHEERTFGVGDAKLFE